ncbi:MAG: hypothetical protein RL293_320 [Bacteroidota bacterium]
MDNIIVYFYGTSDTHMEDFQDQQGALDRELERFIELLNELLPKYHSLLKKDQLDQKELMRLGEIESYLLSLNSKIMKIKGELEQNLFGKSLDTYYKLKDQAREGNPQSRLKMEKMRDAFSEALQAGDIINLN